MDFHMPARNTLVLPLSLLEVRLEHSLLELVLLSPELDRLTFGFLLLLDFSVNLVQLFEDI